MTPNDTAQAAAGKAPRPFLGRTMWKTETYAHNGALPLHGRPGPVLLRNGATGRPWFGGREGTEREPRSALDLLRFVGCPRAYALTVLSVPGPGVPAGVFIGGAGGTPRRLRALFRPQPFYYVLGAKPRKNCAFKGLMVACKLRMLPAPSKARHMGTFLALVPGSKKPPVPRETPGAEAAQAGGSSVHALPGMVPR